MRSLPQHRGAWGPRHEDQPCRRHRGARLHPGGAVARRRGFVPIRKNGKLPHTRVSVAYALEYGEDTIEMHADALVEGERWCWSTI